MMKFVSATVSTLCLTAGAASAATIGIDSFAADQRVVDMPSAGQVDASQVADDTAIGGFRDMQVVNNNGTVEGTELRARNGILGFSNIVMESGRGMISYDGNDDPTSLDTNGLGGIDLTAAGANPFFNFDVVEADRELGFEANVFDIMGGTSSYSEILPGGDNISPRLAFSDFMGDVDFTQVGALEFAIFSTGDNLDGALRSISVQGEDVAPVPLPASALLLAGGLGGMGIFGRRRRKSA